MYNQARVMRLWDSAPLLLLLLYIHLIHGYGGKPDLARSELKQLKNYLQNIRYLEQKEALLSVAGR